MTELDGLMGGGGWMGDVLQESGSIIRCTPIDMYVSCHTSRPLGLLITGHNNYLLTTENGIYRSFPSGVRVFREVLPMAPS